MHKNRPWGLIYIEALVAKFVFTTQASQGEVKYKTIIWSQN